MVLEKYCPKIVDKKTFVEYYSDVGIEKLTEDMEKVCKSYKSLHILGHIPRMLKPNVLSVYAQGLAQKGAEYMLNLPIGEKAKSILAKAADALVQKKESKEGYKNTILVLEELVNGYMGLFNDSYEKFIISKYFKENSLY